MAGSQGIRSVDQHLAAVLADLEPMAAAPMPLLDALDLACAETIVAPFDLPRFDNSAMDGYAVRAADLAGAGPDSPAELPVVGEIGAGQAKLLALSPGAAAKIMTGAPVPAGADAVVPYEWTDRGADRVRVERAPQVGQHIRPAGDDITEGDLLVEEGARLGPRRLGLVASVGRATVLARPRPRVVIISTGSELRDPGQDLGHDSIYDGNSFMLAAAVRRAGALAYRVGIVSDEPGAFLESLEDQLVRADLVITTGGVSQGDYDVVKAALAPQGRQQDVWFGPVAMQPGKPQGYGRVGEDRVPIFTLPGNPVSAYISFCVFVLPALRRLMGITPHRPPTRRARLTVDIASPPEREQYRRGILQDDRVAPAGGAGSHLVGDLASADCLFVVPAETTSLAAGDEVEVLMLEESW